MATINILLTKHTFLLNFLHTEHQFPCAITVQPTFPLLFLCIQNKSPIYCIEILFNKATKQIEIVVYFARLTKTITPGSIEFCLSGFCYASTHTHFHRNSLESFRLAAHTAKNGVAVVKNAENGFPLFVPFERRN